MFLIALNEIYLRYDDMYNFKFPLKDNTLYNKHNVPDVLQLNFSLSSIKNDMNLYLKRFRYYSALFFNETLILNYTTQINFDKICAL